METGDAVHGRKGLELFAERGHQQVFCGYYDSHDGAESARRELAISRGVPGGLGFMYLYSMKYTSRPCLRKTIQMTGFYHTILKFPDT